MTQPRQRQQKLVSFFFFIDRPCAGVVRFRHICGRERAHFADDTRELISIFIWKVNVVKCDTEPIALRARSRSTLNCRLYNTPKRIGAINTIKSARITANKRLLLDHIVDKSPFSNSSAQNSAAHVCIGPNCVYIRVNHFFKVINYPAPNVYGYSRRSNCAIDKFLGNAGMKRTHLYAPFSHLLYIRNCARPILVFDWPIWAAIKNIFGS